MKRKGRVWFPGYVYDSRKRVDMGLLLALAAWLIFNSHTEAFHPYPWMAADGMLGNALFYFISGFGIQSSLSARPQGLVSFSVRRLTRIYVPLLLVGFGFWLILYRGIEQNLFDIITTYVYPTNYTYIKVILPCYLGLWLLDRAPRSWYYLTAVVALVVMVGSYIIESLPRLASERIVLGLLPEIQWNGFFWILVASGAAFARWQVESMVTVKRLFVLASLVLAYLALKFLLLVEGRATALYPLLFALVWGICALSLATLGNPTFVSRMMRVPLIGSFLGLSAALTLEIYLVHEPLTKVDEIYSVPFPLNLGLLVLITLPLAIAVGVLSEILQRAISSDRGLRGGGT